ncbi:MAG TPA: hypothetical protein VM100_02200 [Longimicrobiales bacterium]|nr:hypothetical protein [Longimicrobiales bacterium]
MRRFALLIALMMSACIDAAGPRPRPGGQPDQPQTASVNLLYYELQPRVVTQGVTDSVRLTVVLDNTATLVYLEPRNGTVIELPRTGNNTYSAKISASTLLFGYRQGDLRSTVGFLKVNLGTVTEETPLLVNVKDATVPTITPLSIASGVQAGTHVVNMRFDSLYLGGRFPANVMKAFYANFPDAYTFAAVVEQVQTPNAHFLTIVRNGLRGIGLQVFDNGAPYGSAAALEGVVDYPDDTQFDPAQASNLHELAHRWMNALRLPSLQPGKPHWPLSDIANGMLGWSDPASGDALVFPFVLNPNANGTFSLLFNDTPRTFNDLELYLMGLLPPDSVKSHIVFLNQNQRTSVRLNGILLGPVDTVTAARIIATEGARQPVYAAAQKNFPMVTIVLSRGGLLSRDELSFFEYMAARGEQREALPYFNGAARGVTLPFYSATGGRGTLTTTLSAR